MPKIIQFLHTAVEATLNEINDNIILEIPVLLNTCYRSILNTLSLAKMSNIYKV